MSKARNFCHQVRGADYGDEPLTRTPASPGREVQGSTLLPWQPPALCLGITPLGSIDCPGLSSSSLAGDNEHLQTLRAAGSLTRCLGIMAYPCPKGTLHAFLEQTSCLTCLPRPASLLLDTDIQTATKMRPISSWVTTFLDAISSTSCLSPPCSLPQPAPRSGPL